MTETIPDPAPPGDENSSLAIDAFCGELLQRLQNRHCGPLLLWLLRNRSVAEPILRRVYLAQCDWLAEGHDVDPRAREALETFREFVEGGGNADSLTLARKQARNAARALRIVSAQRGSISWRLAVMVRDASRNDAWESWYKTIGSGWKAKDAEAFARRIREYFSHEANAKYLLPLVNQVASE